MAEIGIMGMRAANMQWREVLDCARLADDLGYSSLSTGESWGGDAFTPLAQFAAVTSRIRIGTSIVPVFARSPANIGMTALNMDIMSEGRFFLGLGTSGQAVVEDLHGEKFVKPLARMREYIDIIRKATRGERINHEGEFFHTQRFRLRQTPIRESIPIYIASLGPESLRMTGELADGWLPIYLAPSRMDRAVAEIKSGAESAGRKLTDIWLSPQVSVYVTNDRPAARDRERPHIAFYIGGMGVFYHRYMRRIGFGEEADRVRAAYLSGDHGGAARLVTDEMVDAMTITGTPDECREQMQVYFDAGVNEIRLVFNEPDGDSLRASIKALAPTG